LAIFEQFENGEKQNFAIFAKFFFSKNSIFEQFENGEKQNLTILAKIQNFFFKKSQFLAIFAKLG